MMMMMMMIKRAYLQICCSVVQGSDWLWDLDINCVIAFADKFLEARMNAVSLFLNANTN